MGNNFDNELNKLSKKLNKIAETKSITFGELFTNEFLATCSNFSSLEDMFEKSGFKVETPEDFAAIPDSDWEVFIQNNTSYESWEDMQTDAANHYMQSILDSDTL